MCYLIQVIVWLYRVKNGMELPKFLIMEESGMILNDCVVLGD